MRLSSVMASLSDSGREALRRLGFREWIELNRVPIIFPDDHKALQRAIEKGYGGRSAHRHLERRATESTWHAWKRGGDLGDAIEVGKSASEEAWWVVEA